MLPRAVLAVALAAATLALAGVAQAAPAVPSLQDETLVPTNQRFNRAQTCDAAGFSVIPVHWSGLAFGPYPGTFSEDGTITLGPQSQLGAGMFGFALGDVIAFDVNFEIDSPVGIVTGTKHLAAPLPANPFPIVGDTQGPQNTGLCTTFSGVDFLGIAGASGDFTDVRATLRYEASVQSAAGGSDSGTALVEALEGTAVSPANAGIGGGEELFTLSSAVPEPQLLTLSPAAATSAVDTPQTVTATVGTATQRAPGVTVHFSVAGADTLSGTCTTDANGTCDFGYQGPPLPGADLIQAWADSNGNGSQEADEPTASATRAFTEPISTIGEARGAGRLEQVTKGPAGRVSFEFHANSGPKDETKCNVEADHVRVRCLDATAVVITPTHVTIFGNATVNGQPTTYRIDADDLAGPGHPRPPGSGGAGRDTFTIQTASGFTAGGVIRSGDVEIKE
jgi:hypothetical protein